MLGRLAVPSRTLDTLLQELKIDTADYNFINIVVNAIHSDQTEQDDQRK